jgi:anti-sigma regulatory factor (Ser/Thr protein kinase)
MSAEDREIRHRPFDGQETPRLQLALANDIAEIPRMAAAIERFSSDCGLPLEVVDGVNIALDELFTNVVRYGYLDGGAHQIDVRLSLSAQRLTIEITDDGQPFNPLDRPPPDLESPLEERAVGGLGIHFVRSLMDEVEYRRDGDRNTLRMVKTLTTG